MQRLHVAWLAMGALSALLLYYNMQQDLVVRPSTLPHALPKPLRYTVQGRAFVDAFVWLKHLDDDALLYLEQEAAYTQHAMQGTRHLQSLLVQELLQSPETHKVSLEECTTHQRVWEDGDYVYWTRTVEGMPLYYRSPMVVPHQQCPCLETPVDTPVLLNVSAFVPANTSYFYMGVFEVHPQHPELLAFSFDTVGNEAYGLHVWNASSQSLVTPTGGIPGTYDAVRWISDGSVSWLYYNVLDPTLLIPRRIERVCVVGCSSSGLKDAVYEEADVTLTVGLSTTSDQAHAFVTVKGQVTSEWWDITRGQAPEAVYPRVENVTYDLDHSHGYFYVRTNANEAFNYRVVRVSNKNPQSAPVVVLPHADDRLIEKIQTLKDYLIAWVRQDGLRQILMVSLTDPNHTTQVLRFHDAQDPTTQVYSVFPGTLDDMDARLRTRFDSPCLLFTNSSLVRPPQTYYHHIPSHNTRVVSLSARLPAEYREQRVWAPSSSNPSIRIPISLVYKGDLSGPRRLLLVAYGAYGGFYDTVFTRDILPLLDRGLVYAIAHPRGDADLGTSWYTNGKYEHKVNTFLDVATCVHYLVGSGWTRKGWVALYGRSAGGLVTGWSFRHLADSVRVIVSQVPYVDPIYDMMDANMPWTPFEWFEWGHPNRSLAVLNAMTLYSPYLYVQDVCASGLHPALLVTGGMNDPRVPFYEPAKFVAACRYGASQSSPSRLAERKVLLSMTNAGHFSSETASQRVSDLAFWYAFLLTELGVTH